MCATGSACIRPRALSGVRFLLMPVDAVFGPPLSDGLPEAEKKTKIKTANLQLKEKLERSGIVKHEWQSVGT